MKYPFFVLFCSIFSQFQILGQQVFQLAPPVLTFESKFFDKKTPVNLKFEMAKTRIHFTLDDSEPTEKSPIFRKPIFIKKHSTQLRARVFAEGFSPSEIVAMEFFRRGIEVKKVEASPAPDPKFAGSGERTLVDGKGGFEALFHPTWQGFQADSVVLNVEFSAPKTIRQAAVNAMQGQSAWVFLPRKIAVFYKKPNDERLYFLAEQTFPAAAKNEKTSTKILFLNFPKVKTLRLVLKIYPLPSIPDWHDGRGTRAWIFLDEVNFY